MPVPGCGGDSWLPASLPGRKGPGEGTLQPPPVDCAPDLAIEKRDASAANGALTNAGAIMCLYVRCRSGVINILT